MNASDATNPAAYNRVSKIRVAPYNAFNSAIAPGTQEPVTEVIFPALMVDYLDATDAATLSAVLDA